MTDETNDNDIFRTFRILTPAQIKCNAVYVAKWVVGGSIVIAGVVIAVLTGIIWISPVLGIIGICPLLFVPRLRNIRYTPRFGMKYTMLRLMILGFLVYGEVGWRGLLGFYNYLRWKQDWNISISTYGWTISAISLAITLISNLSLYRKVDVRVADLAGTIEMTALGILIGSIMFLILYT